MFKIWKITFDDEGRKQFDLVDSTWSANEADAMLTKWISKAKGDESYTVTTGYLDEQMAGVLL